MTWREMLICMAGAGVVQSALDRLFGRRRPVPPARPIVVERVLHTLTFPPGKGELRALGCGDVPDWMWASAGNN